MEYKPSKALKEVQKRRAKATAIFHEALARLKDSVSKADKLSDESTKKVEKKKAEIEVEESLINEMGIEKKSIQNQMNKIEEFLGE